MEYECTFCTKDMGEMLKKYRATLHELDLLTNQVEIFGNKHLCGLLRLRCNALRAIALERDMAVKETTGEVHVSTMATPSNSAIEFARSVRQKINSGDF